MPWVLSQTLEIEYVLTEVEAALALGMSEIWNSDQDGHLTSPQYLDCLKFAGVQVSMDGRGRALNNIFYRAALALHQVRESLFARFCQAKGCHPKPIPVYLIL